MNVIDKFDAAKAAGLLELINYKSSPCIGGCMGYIYQHEVDGTVFAVLSTDDDTITGIVPNDYADRARSLDYDPYNDARYTQDSIDLVLSALARATLHQQIDQKESCTGGYYYSGSFIWHRNSFDHNYHQ
ncbi:MAG TPA: hypothetical protein VIF10_10530 [Methylobacter sp.]|jgi:hypothetical protein